MHASLISRRAFLGGAVLGSAAQVNGLVRQGVISEERINQSYYRIISLKRQLVG